MKILVAEDDPLSRRVLQLTLQNAGHELLLTETGAQAWEMCLTKSCQIIVSDWMMPEMDGLEFCRKVRARRRREYTYFILLTARVGRENYQAAMNAGVDDFLTKPLNADELLNRVRVAERLLGFMNQVRELKRLLPICSYCKKIRDDKDYWHQIETYIHDHTGSDFSHSICPKCYSEHIVPQLEALQAENERLSSGATPPGAK